MLVPKRDADISSQKFKQFKKFSLDLYQKQYHIYENELTLSAKHKRTNSEIIQNINSKIPLTEQPKDLKAIKLQVKLGPKSDELFSLKNYNFNYNQNVNIAINQNTSFHFNTNLQTENGYGVYSVSPALSYQLRHTYYRVSSLLN